MNTHDCKTIQREIDEANLDARFSVEANEHLSRCDSCRRFRDDRRALRSLMAELETVGAPADFDFRLRARLARERPSNGFGHLLLSTRSVAAVALIALMVMVAVVVKNRMSSAVAPTIANGTNPLESVSPSQVTRTAPLPGPLAASNDPGKDVTTADVPSQGPAKRQTGNGTSNRVSKKAPNTSAGNIPRLAIRESAGTGAEMIMPEFGGLVVVPVDARAFKLSIDNGRGSARTISLPPVSFGSQRLIAREASFAPVSSAKGDW